MLSNSIRKKILKFEDNNIIFNIKTEDKSYVDFVIDVNQIKSEAQRIAVLIIVIGLIIP